MGIKRDQVRLEDGLAECKKHVLQSDMADDAKVKALEYIESAGQSVNHHFEAMKSIAHGLDKFHPVGVKFGACYVRFGTESTDEEVSEVTKVSVLFKDLSAKFTAGEFDETEYARRKEELLKSLK